MGDSIQENYVVTTEISYAHDVFGMERFLRRNFSEIFQAFP